MGHHRTSHPLTVRNLPGLRSCPSRVDARLHAIDVVRAGGGAYLRHRCGEHGDTERYQTPNGHAFLPKLTFAQMSAFSAGAIPVPLEAQT